MDLVGSAETTSENEQCHWHGFVCACLLQRPACMILHAEEHQFKVGWSENMAACISALRIMTPRLCIILRAATTADARATFMTAHVHRKCKPEEQLIMSLARWKSLTSNLSTVPVRKAASHHGKARRIEGLTSRKRVLHKPLPLYQEHVDHDLLAEPRCKESRGTH